MSKVVFRGGICTGVACAPATMKRAGVEKAVNAEHPTGLDSPWTVSKRRELKDGTKLPARCMDNENRRHWLMEC
jgi:hypothetical protein